MQRGSLPCIYTVDPKSQQVDLNIDTQKDIADLLKAMTHGIRKWERVLYPMMIAFILLAV
ncbi:hypothetical protein [Thiomicrorhabdus sp.]|uniref:hypothetical protein n=1 Tax=Thiomicrorhabdus sp. TaxID=2039724 RepID=UPI0035658145